MEHPVCVEFNDLSKSSKEEILAMTDHYRDMCTPERRTQRVLDLMRAQKSLNGGAKVDLLEHGVQCATRALRDGAEEELVVAALMHDIGEQWTPCNHGEFAASLLRPYVSERTWWILQNHEVFQGFYYFNYVGGDRNKRDVYKDNPHYQATIDFCAKYDAPAFDPSYDSLPLEHFEPMIKRIFSRKPFAHLPDDPKAIAVLGDQDQV